MEVVFGFWAMVLIVLIAFALGMVVGVLGMVPRWWRQRQAAKAVQVTTATPPTEPQPDVPHGT